MPSAGRREREAGVTLWLSGPLAAMASCRFAIPPHSPSSTVCATGLDRMGWTDTRVDQLEGHQRRRYAWGRMSSQAIEASRVHRLTPKHPTHCESLIRGGTRCCCEKRELLESSPFVASSLFASFDSRRFVWEKRSVTGEELAPRPASVARSHAGRRADKA